MKNVAPKLSADRGLHGWIGTETVESPFGNFEFDKGYPTAGTAQRLEELQIFSRAIEVYLSQTPAVSMFHLRKGLQDFGARASNHFVIWESLMDARTLLLTGNCETVYGLNFLDLKRDGPTVVETPPMLLGGLGDMWQEQIMDIGPTGSDKGEGGKFLILPPDYDGTIPGGYFAAKSRTNGVFLGLRGFLVNAKPDKAVASMKGIKIYPVGKPSPRAMSFLNGSGEVMDTLFPDSHEFFESLAQLIDQEPADAISSSDRFNLATIGIVKGRRFEPDPAHVRLLSSAARLGSAIARRNGFASTDPERMVYSDRQWEWAFIGGSASWDSQGYVNTDRRAAFAYSAIGMSPAMVRKVVGAGSQYFWTMHDSKRNHLDGGKNYHLNLPAGIPVKNFWSVVVYDAESRSMLRNDQSSPSVSQYTNPEKNPDGSIDILFGPTAPQGKDRNWIQTINGKGWFPILRFYGPLQPLFDQSWKPGDIEALSESRLLRATGVSPLKRNEELSPEQVQALAQEALVFGFPLVYLATQSDVRTSVSKPEGTRAPLNQFAHYRKFPDATSREFAGINVDTLYSIAHLDLSDEPIVLSIPPTGDRYWIMSILDAWNDVAAAPGARTIGGSGGDCVIVGPKWKDRLPRGMTEYRVQTSLAMLCGRIYATGESELVSIYKLQDQYRLTPLSKWGTTHRPPSSVPIINPDANTETPVALQVFAMPAENFFSRLNELLLENPAHSGDTHVLSQFAKLGIAPGGRLQMDHFGTECRNAIEEGLRAGQAEIRSGCEKIGDVVNGWTIAREIGRYGTSYALRASQTLLGIGRNLFEDAFYPSATQDSEGNLLNGSNKYQLRFSKDQLPPVQGFWSLTMYDADSYLIPNALHRYSRGSRDKLNYDTDGSLTLYIQREQPANDRIANWLPAPEDGLRLVLRLYWPNADVAEEKWMPPPVERMKQGSTL